MPERLGFCFLFRVATAQARLLLWTEMESSRTFAEAGVPSPNRPSSRVQEQALAQAAEDQQQAAADPPLWTLLEVADVLERVRGGVGLTAAAMEPGLLMGLEGSQVFAGVTGGWRLAWSLDDGRFYEEFEGEEMTLQWLHDAQGHTWKADASGRVNCLALDDREAKLLAVWVRTSFWLTPAAAERVRLWVCDPACEPASRLREEAGRREVLLGVALADGKVEAIVAVDMDTWRPVRMAMGAYDGRYKWELRDWQPAQSSQGGLLFPMRMEETPSGEGLNFSQADPTGAQWGGKRAFQVGSHLFEVPASGVFPRRHARAPSMAYNSSSQQTEKLQATCSGQYVVKPLVDGRDMGYFLFDTGASLLTFDPVEVHTRYRRGRTFQLGPVEIQNPVFAEIDGGERIAHVLLSELLKNKSQGQQVTGICGYDVFRDCVVEMSPFEETLVLHEPEEFARNWEQEHGQAVDWHPLVLVKNLPCVNVRLPGGQEALFLLDTGAAGEGVLFNARAVERLGLQGLAQSTNTEMLIGVAGEDHPLEVTSGILDHLEFAGITFEKVPAQFSQQREGALELSEYVSGIICVDLLFGFTVLLDYRRRRMALIED